MNENADQNDLEMESRVERNQRMRNRLMVSFGCFIFLPLGAHHPLPLPPDYATDAEDTDRDTDLDDFFSIIARERLAT